MRVESVADEAAVRARVQSPLLVADPISLQQGSQPAMLVIGTVSGASQPPGQLTAFVNGAPSATVNGVRIAGIAISAAGVITASVTAECNAGNAAFVLSVGQGGSASASATLNITVTANTPPLLGYAGEAVSLGGALVINPLVTPSDNGGLSSVVVRSKGSYGGSISISPGGVISVSGARPRGVHTIVIRATDNCGLTVDADFALSVDGAGSVISLVSSPASSLFGQQVTLTATVAPQPPATGIPTGTVTFRDGSNTLCVATLNGSGSAVCATASLPTGSRSITATYSGDNNFGGADSPVVAQVVNRAGTVTTLISSRNPSREGEPVVFSATVTAVSPGSGVPTGTVTFRDGTTAICTSSLNSAARAECSIASFIAGIAGTREITATYNGDTNFTISTSPVLRQTINPASADLGVSITADPGLVSAGTRVTYVITVTNAGPGIATDVVVTDTLPATLTFVSCSATRGGICEGSGNNRTVILPSLAAGVAATITLSASVSCLNASSAGIGNTVTVSSAVSDLNPGNNSATTVVSPTPGMARVTLDNGQSSVDFGSVVVTRDSVSPTPSTTLTIDNTGCLPLVLGLSVRRNGSDAGSGKISNPDDSATFPISIINDSGVESRLSFSGGSARFSISGGGRVRLRIAFSPAIPAPAGAVTGLSAGHVIPPEVTADLLLRDSGGALLTSLPLVGRISTRARMINPLSTRLSPLVALARTGGELAVEFSVFDPDLDLYLVSYQFLDSQGRPVGEAPNFDLSQALSQSSMLKGQSFTLVKRFTAGASLASVSRVRVTIYDREGTEAVLSGEVNQVVGRVVSVSAASFMASGVASEAITSAFGAGLANSTRSAATTPLPTELGGTRVIVRDSSNVERLAPLFFIDPTQINYQIPEGTAPGRATVIVAQGDQATATEAVEVGPTSPGLFSANATGDGAAAALALRVKPDGAVSYEQLSAFDQAQGRFVSRPLSMGSESDLVYLVLFGTGIRHRSSLSNVFVRIGGLEVPAEYAGPQNGFAGLDQVNIRLPAVLAGRGEVDLLLSVDGKVSNTVKVNIQ